MKTILQFTSDGKYELVIHAESDLEAIALQAWSEKYFDAPYFREEKMEGVKAYLLISFDMEKRNNGETNGKP